MSTYPVFLHETTALTPITYPKVVYIEGPVNTHTHPRDTDAQEDGRAEMHIPRLAEVYEVALGMGNTRPPLITVVRAQSGEHSFRAANPS
jgi:dihydroorotase